MSLILVILSISLIDVCIYGMEQNKPTPISRICVLEKDYVDASVMFRDEFWVIVDRMYYAYNWYAPPFVYKAEGLQELALKEYDQIGDKDPGSVKRGRYLGGFYQNTIDLEFIGSDLTMDDFILNRFSPKSDNITDQIPDEEEYEDKHVNELPSNHSNSVETDPFEDIMTTEEYFNYMSKTQVIVYKEEHKHNKDRYHYKRMNKLKGVADGLIENKTAFVNHFETGPLNTRATVDNLLKLGLPQSSVSLPMVLDFPTLTLFVIMNQNKALDVPRLYYNSFKYRQFHKTWKNVTIPKGYRYNAFIPKLLAKPGVEIQDEIIRYFEYRVIAEPFRDETDKQRGPSFLFELEFTWKILGEPNSTEPKLIKMPETGMSAFDCEFKAASSVILYTVFGLIIVVLAIILIIMLCFVSINYFNAKERIVIIKRKSTKRDASESQRKRANSLDNTRLRHKTETGVSVADKRSAHPSIESDRKTTTSVKKIKI